MNQTIWFKIKGVETNNNEKPLLKSKFLKENGKIRIFYGYDKFVLYGKAENQPYKKINLDFDTKFEIIRKPVYKIEEGDETLGQIIGLLFMREDGEKILPHYNLFASEQQIKEWRNYLSSRINQWQFHELFRVFKKIGQGNFATVYLGQRIEDEMQFAIKAFTKKAAYNHENGKESIINELKIMRNLNNKHLMKLKEVYETSNSLYMILELLEGGSLYDMIKKRKMLQLDQIKEILASVLLGLQDMHKSNIMHRDLKLENILFRSKRKLSTATIVDFGLATKANEPYLHIRCGTPGYVAPEIINLVESNQNSQSIRYSTQCDIYSLGLIFYILLSGRPAFRGKSYRTVVRQNRKANINYSKEIFDKTPEDALSFLKRMLEFQPSLRISIDDCLTHPFLKETVQQILEDEDDLDSSFSQDDFEENVDVNSAINKFHQKLQVIDASKKLNSPTLQSPDEQSPGWLLRKEQKQQKHIDSQQVLSGQSPLFLCLQGSIDSLRSLEQLNDKNNLQPSPQIKPSRFSFSKKKNHHKMQQQEVNYD